MSLPKNIFLITLLAGLLPVFAHAGTGLYGFDSINPYTNSEKILHMDYLPDSVRNYRADMRDNLLMLVDYARKHNPDFQVLSHEGQELLYKSRWEYELEGYNRVRTLKENANDPVFLFSFSFSSAISALADVSSTVSLSIILFCSAMISSNSS